MYEISVWRNQSVGQGFFIYSARINCKEVVSYCEGSGTSLDRKIAKRKAIYESIERFCGSTIPKGLLRDTYANLSNQAYDPNKLIPFSETQYKKNFPYKRYRSGSKIEWAKGLLLNKQQEIFIPAFAVYLGYNLQIPVNQKLAPITSSGLAIQKNYNTAVSKGIFELIERDAAMRSWLQKTVVGIDLTDIKSGELKKFLRIVDAERLRAEAFLSTQATPIPSVMGVIFGLTPRIPYATFGLSTEVDIEIAILKALEEALMVRDTLVRLKKEDSLGLFEKKPSQIKTFLDHALYYSQPGTKRQWAFLLEQPQVSIEEVKRKLESASSKTYTLKKLVKLLEKSGHKDILVVNLSNNLAKSMSLQCVRVLIPTLRPMEMDHNIKFENYDRIYSTERTNRAPHPFT